MGCADGDRDVRKVGNVRSASGMGITDGDSRVCTVVVEGRKK